ncbi:hypothetical protein [Tropicimonas marinistellae]|uniref:hypothetical protein n=1 Tax=Tropicimonas marinistellae TaxID=1739787 RepID=UPI0008331CA3|nr:hypothetical protein [Tropicimonas marinistellae]
MTKNLALILALLGVLAACSDGSGSNPVFNGEDTAEDGDDGDTGDGDDGDDTDDGDDGDDTDDGDDGSIDGDSDLPPGTTSPSAKKGIIRYEAYDEDAGTGFARQVSYDSDTDTFLVNNLGFDGTEATPYTRGVAVGSLGPFAVYEAVDTVVDPLSGEEIEQFPHKAIYGVSRSGATRFAIVRTGAYVDYGYGGFIYERDGSVVLPTEGQATYEGDYAGLRDFNGRDGVEYSTGTMNVDIDFEDFDNGGAVKGYVTDRAIFDIDGNEVTQDILDALAADTGSTVTALPTLIFKVGPGHLDKNGEIAGEINSWKPGTGDSLEEFESGNYYAVISGDDAEEIVGVIVVESEDPRYESVTVRETGGFILSR